MGDKDRLTKRKYEDQPEKNPMNKHFKKQLQGGAHPSGKNLFSVSQPSKLTTKNEKRAGTATLKKSRRKQGTTNKSKEELLYVHGPRKKLDVKDSEMSDLNSNEMNSMEAQTNTGTGAKRKSALWENRTGRERKRKWAMNKLKRQKRLECKTSGLAELVACSSETVPSDKDKKQSEVKTQLQRKSTKVHEMKKGLPGKKYRGLKQSKSVSIHVVKSNPMQPSQITVTSSSSEKNAVDTSSPPPEVCAVSSNWKQLQTLMKKTLQPKVPKRCQQMEKLKKSTVEDPSKDPSRDPMVDDKQNNPASSSQIWFDDVDDILIETMKRTEEHKRSNQESSESKSDNRLVKTGSYPGLTKVVAIDCEMVGVGEGGKESVLARVSIVNQFGHCVYDKYVKPIETVTDYRTHVSGIRPQDLKKGEEFYTVQKDVGEIIKGRLLVGHAIENDLKVLYLDHPKKKIRDTSRYKPFRKMFDGRKPALRKLADKLLSVKVQDGEHNSVQDAQATMRLYTVVRREWEKDINERRRRRSTVPLKHTRTHSISAS